MQHTSSISMSSWPPCFDGCVSGCGMVEEPTVQQLGGRVGFSGACHSDITSVQTGGVIQGGKYVATFAEPVRLQEIEDGEREHGECEGWESEHGTASIIVLTVEDDGAHGKSSSFNRRFLLGKRYVENNKDNLSTCGMVAENHSSASGFCALSHNSLGRTLAALRTDYVSHFQSLPTLQFLPLRRGRSMRRDRT